MKTIRRNRILWDITKITQFRYFSDAKDKWTTASRVNLREHLTRLQELIIRAQTDDFIIW